MKRIETYIGQQVMEWCFSAQAQNEMVGLSKLSAAVLGTGVLANGLACGPTSPATMTVQIGPGELYSMQSLEATACGTLPADTTHQILKQGIQLGTFTTGTLAAPLTTGQSINYLIETQYQDSDISIDPTTGISPVVLQFFNAANPAVPWSGPNNSGSTSNTFRDGIIAYQVKAGTAAATGSQVTPTPDAGWTGLWVVSVPFAASTLTSGNISSYSAAPILPSGLLQSLISGNLTYGIDAGSANVIQATYPVPITSLVDNMELWVKVKTANTGATTFTPNPGVISASPVVGAAHAALQGGEYIANGRALHVWRADISSWVLVECTGAAIQIAPATASQHAVQLAQLFGGLKGLVKFTSSGSWTCPANVTTVYVSGAGGGGGGGGTLPVTATGNIVAGGGGGGAGQNCLRVAVTVVPGNVYTVTLGAAGAAGAISGANGGAGGTTSFGSLAVMNGGSGGGLGSGGSSGASWAGGPGGAGGSGGTLAQNGVQGSDSSDSAPTLAATSGPGGMSPFGGAGMGRRGAASQGLTGVQAQGYGSGGGGGSGTYGGTVTSLGAAGGAGGSGILYIEW